MDVSLGELRELVIDREAVVCCNSWCLKESDRTEHPCKEVPNRNPKLEQFRKRGLTPPEGPSEICEHRGKCTSPKPMKHKP